MTSAMTLCMHVARNVKGEPEFYTGTFFWGGGVHSPDPHHLLFSQTRAVCLDNRQTDEQTWACGRKHIPPPLSEPRR